METTMSDIPQDVLLMLGEMRGDLKYLVNERRQHSERLTMLEETHTAMQAENDLRFRKLENFKTRIGVVTAALGFGAPFVVTAVLHKLGLV